MGRPMLWKGKYMLTQDIGKGGNYYYTVVRDIGRGKNNPHAHFNNIKAAKLAMHFAIKERIPNRYSGYMVAAIKRLLMIEDKEEKEPRLIFKRMVKRK